MPECAILTMPEDVIDYSVIVETAISRGFINQISTLNAEVHNSARPLHLAVSPAFLGSAVVSYGPEVTEKLISFTLHRHITVLYLDVVHSHNA